MVNFPGRNPEAWTEGRWTPSIFLALVLLIRSVLYSESRSCRRCGADPSTRMLLRFPAKGRAVTTTTVMTTV